MMWICYWLLGQALGLWTALMEVSFTDQEGLEFDEG
jgi:hypothetical protein